MEGAACAAAEREVIDVAARSLARSLCVEAPHVGRPQFSRRRVIARALALIEASEGQPLVVQDLCRAAQVSERTLRNVFREYFGVGPMRLVRVRQLHEIRCALANADAICNTVTRVASQFGVWDFSLFARNYKALYGESPSDTLHRPPRRRDAFAQRSWIRYALRTCVDEAPGVAQRDDDALRPVERLAERVGCNV
jgi:AraC family ethanolamine operon transcriptional activator